MCFYKYILHQARGKSLKKNLVHLEKTSPKYPQNPIEILKFSKNPENRPKIPKIW